MTQPRDDHDEVPATTPTPSASSRWLRRIAVAVLGLVVLALLVGAGAWQATGGRWQVIATPSMGTTAPVGTLVVTRPATTAELTVGDIVTYRPPITGRRDTTTHRVVAIERADGATVVRTKGDVNGAPDPWVVRSSDLVGRVVAIGWGLGWLVKALPLLVTGGLLVWWATRLWAPALWRVPLRVLGFSVLLSTATFVLKPFVGVVSMGSSIDAAGTHVAVVATGLLPVRVAAATGGSVDLVDGQVGILTTTLPPDSKGAVLTTGLHMPVWLWAVMVVLWLLPLVYGLIAGRRDLERLAASDDDRDTGGDGGADGGGSGTSTVRLVTLVPAPRHEPLAAAGRVRSRLVGSALVTVTVLGLVLTTAGTTAAFTARVTNSADTAATNPFFTCTAAEQTIGSDYFLYPLDDATVSDGSAARDLSGNNRPGAYTTSAFSTTTNRPCPRDTSTRAVTINPTNTNQGYVAGPNTRVTVGTFGMAIWFRTTNTQGGRIFGFGAARTGQSTTTDRHIYMTNAGALIFGVKPGGTVTTIASANGYNDGQWHLVVATQSPAGMLLYLDGAQVAANPSVTTGENSPGYFRLGWDTLAGWPSRPTTDYWSGSLAYAALYGSGGLPDATEVAQLYAAGT